MIRVNKREGGASKLASFTLDDDKRLSSKEQLGECLTAAKDRDNIGFVTSGDAAKDQIMGINNAGTTVTLNGEYKY